MKIFKLFFAVAAFVVSLGAQATDTRYDFSFTANNGVKASGWFVLDDSWASSTSWQAVTASDFNGYLDVNGNTGITSGAFSSLYVNNIPTLNGNAPYGIGFQVGGIDYIALANKATGFGAASYAYSLDYKYITGVGIGSTTTTISSEILLANQSFTVEAVSAHPVPEIDGSKLPQAALLILALVFMVSRLKASRPRFNGQFA